MSIAPNLADLRESVQVVLPAYLADLEKLVNIDSGTFLKSGVDEVTDHLEGRYRELGADIDRRPSRQHGDNLVASFRGQGTGNVLLIGHTDTVYPPGTAIGQPFRIEGERALGPGVADMKGGDLLIPYALRALFEKGFTDFGRIAVVHNSDEEIGSAGSRQLVREQSERADAVLVLEPGRENGAIVSARKGIVDFQLEVRGRSAHSGVNHDRGRSAVLEMAHLITDLEAINGTVEGATLNVGIVKGGERPNIVPDYAFAHFEARAYDPEALADVERRVREVVDRRRVDGTSVQLESSLEHVPMFRSEGTDRLLAVATSLAQDLGFELTHVATGGGSDGNTAAAMGKPVLDGLGPVGGAAHSPAEYIELASIVPRASLLAGLIVAVGEGRW